MPDIIISIAVAIILVSIAISAVRFFKGPGTVDRVVAFDVTGFIAISLIVIFAHMAQRIIYLDVALVYGLLAFLGVIVVARYIERGL